MTACLRVRLRVAFQRRVLVAALCLAGNLVVGLNMFSVAPLLPLIIADYGLSRLGAGLLVSLPMLVGGILGFPAAIVAARWGVRVSCLSGWLAMCLGLFPWGHFGYGGLLAARFCYGVGWSFLFVSIGPLLLGWFSTRAALAMNTVNPALLILGVAAAFAVLPPLAALTGWVWAAALAAAPGTLGFALWLRWGADAAAPRLLRSDWRALRRSWAG